MAGLIVLRMTALTKVALQIQQSPSELHCSLHRDRENSSTVDTEAHRDPHCHSNSKQNEQRASTKAGLEL